ncbi:MAG: B12-binding domain-containing radical SAM protein [Candidatus Omnitrophica bacterium]|nr:B12-binding domain-containing radical SAM protein [Candidatus Omnitrophota bacterium]
MKKKILLTIWPPFWPKIPPLGIASLQEFLLKKHIKADLSDFNNIFYNLSPPDLKKSYLVSCPKAFEENIHGIIKNNFRIEYEGAINKILQYDIVGFSCFKSNLNATLKTIKDLKTKKAGIEIILGGPEITRLYLKNPDKFSDEIENLSDSIVVGEGELPILNYITKKSPSKKISRFYELDNLKELPFPKYNGIDLQRYPKKDAISILFSRGCFKKCTFCSERLLHKKFRTRPVSDVIKEIDYHLSNNGIKYFIFHDSMINADLKKLEKLCEAIIEKFGSVKWEAQLYIRDDISQTLLEKMKKSGCYNLFIGLESGCDKTLRNMNKGFATKTVLSLFKKLVSSDLSFGVSIIVGYPGETEKDFRESLNFLIRNKELIPKIEQLNPFTYYDGTDTDKKFDYSINKSSLARFRIFIDEIKRHNIRHTNAFLGNLIEKDAGI